MALKLQVPFGCTANFPSKKFVLFGRAPTILKTGLGQSLLFKVLLTCILRILRFSSP
jgi:hypothetical protein